MGSGLAHKVKQALDEGRILILGSQVLLGFQFRAVFETGFDALPGPARALTVAGLGLLVVTTGLLIWPAAYHRIVVRGEVTHGFHDFITAVTHWALLPLALSLGGGVFIVTTRIVAGAATVVGVAGTAVALLAWYGLPWLVRAARGAGPPSARIVSPGRTPMDEVEPTSLERKIEEVLTECRVVLPGAQALLGFQLAIVLTEAFDRLPLSSRYVHLASLGAIALTTVLLIAPAAYHRIVERGEDTPGFLRFASATLLASLVTLALGMVGDLFVVVGKITGSRTTGVCAALLSLVVLYGAWFGLTTARRRRAGRTGGDHAATRDGREAA